VVIKVFFAVLVLCTIAVVAVVLAVHLRVKRHLDQGEAPAPPVVENAADETAKTAEEQRPKPSS